MKSAFFGAIFVTKNGQFLPLGFCFSPYRHDDPDRLFHGLDLLPFIGGLGAASVPVGEAVLVRLAEFRIARTAAFGDFDKFQRLQFADGWCDGMAADSIVFEVIERDRQFAVIITTVMPQLDFDASENAMGGMAQHAVCGRLQHLDETPRKLPVDFIAPHHALGHDDTLAVTAW
jgi:hypothetical protein